MKIAVLTAGGVTPGMNAAVRAVAQKAFSLGWEVVGAEGGFGGILEGSFGPMDRSQLGGSCAGAEPFSGAGAPRRSGSPRDRSVRRRGCRKPA